MAVFILELLVNYRLGKEKIFITTLERHTQLEEQINCVRRTGVSGGCVCPWKFVYFTWVGGSVLELVQLSRNISVDIVFLYFFITFPLFFHLSFFLACLRSWVCLKLHIFIVTGVDIPFLASFSCSCLQLGLGLSLGSH